jgi:hypothetical protein
MAQDSTRAVNLPMTSEYYHHVHMANLAEESANVRRGQVKSRLERKHPLATEEWWDMECSKDFIWKGLVATQQFHVRQATMYGLGAILEALSSKG